MSAGRPILVGTFAELKDAAAALAGADRFYVDTEFEMGGPVRKLCLIQISRGAEVYLVDTVKLTALEPLAEVLSRNEAEWVFHDGGQDLAWLHEVMKFPDPPRLFDTQVAWGLLGPEYPVSLAYLLYRILGLRDAKAEQAGDWLARPLSPEKIEYAAKDVAHLPEIREWLGERLRKLGRESLVHEVSKETITPPPPEALTIDTYRNAWQLDAAGQAALRFLIDWYSGLSAEERRDGPSPRVFLQIAKVLPETGEELARIKGVYGGWARRAGDKFAGKLILASAAGSKAGFQPLEPPPYATFEEILAEGWLRKATAEVSAEQSLAPPLAFPDRVFRAMTKAIVEKGDRSAAAHHLAGWRATVLRDPFLGKSRG